MPALGAVIGSLVGIGGGLSLGGIGAALAKVAAGIGLTYAARALAGKPDDLLGTGSQPSGVQTSVAAGDSNARSFLIGKWATPGQIIYMKTWGETDKVPHAYLVQVYKISDLPIEEITDIYVDGSKITWSDNADSNRGYAIPEYRKNGIDYLWINVHKGNQGSADDYLVNKFQTGDRDWSTKHIGLGVAYAVVTSRWSEKFFNGSPPEVLFVAHGVKLYDPTRDSSVGGSGPQRWDVPSTYEHSNNPMVIVYNLMRGIKYKGEWVYGMQTVTAGQMPYAAWAAAILECALIVYNKDGSSNAQYRAGAEIRMDTEVGSEIAEFLKTCNGRIADCGGIYKPKVGPQVSSGTAVAAFTDNNLVIVDEHEFDMFPSLDEVINGIDGTYIYPGDGWQEKALPPKRKNSYIAEDDGRENIADITYAHVFDKQQAQRLSSAILNESRRFRRHVIVLPPEAFVLEPLDFVSWTSERNGYLDKLFRVESIADRSNGDQVIGLQEVEPSDYDWSPDIDEQPVFDAPLGPDHPPPQEIKNFNAIPFVIDGGLSIDRPGIRFTWDGADLDDVDMVKFEVRFLTPTGPLATQDEMSSPDAGIYELTQGLTSGVVYVVRAILDNLGSTRDFVWSPWITLTTPETPVFIEAFADELQNLINAGSASGAVITEKVDPPPAGMQNLYRITVYGTGANADKSAGFYLFVDSNGIPGGLIDIENIAIGSLTQRQFPFVIEAGVVKIKRGNVQALQATEIAAGAITADKLAVGSISAQAIADGAISAAKIAALAVDASKIGAGAITSAKLAAGSVDSTALGNAAVVASKMAALSVPASAIQNAAITSTKIAAGQIFGSHIGAGQISAGHIQAGVLSAYHIAPLSIDGTRIAELTIDATRITSGTITADKLISADELDAYKITVKHIKGGEISTRYFRDDVTNKKASVIVNKKGGVILVGTFTYKCDKNLTLAVMICKAGQNDPLNGGAKYKIRPGDDIKAGAAQITAIVDQDQNDVTYELRTHKENDGADVDNFRLLALRVAP